MWQPLPAGFVYQLGPIDYWPGWAEIDEAVAQCGGSDDSQVRTELQRIAQHAFDEFRKRTDWEGDVVTGPIFSGLPPSDGNADGDVMLAIKQSNNGTVFVWSPYELPWLGEYAA